MFARPLILITGKGGTGKTTIAAAAALLLARRGKRVLLAATDRASGAGALLECQPPGVPPVEVAGGLDLMYCDPADAARAYLERLLRIGPLARRVEKSSMFQAFYAAAPGLPQLLTVWRLTRLASGQELFRGVAGWDHIVVDAPATGHAFALVEAPFAAAGHRLGPLRATATRTRDFLLSAAEVHVVTLAEELPVEEAVESCKRFRTLGLVPSSLIASSVLPLCITEKEVESLEVDELEASFGKRGGAVALETARVAARLSARARRNLDDLRLRTSCNVYEVPYVPCRRASGADRDIRKSKIENRKSVPLPPEGRRAWIEEISRRLEEAVAEGQ